MDHKSIYTEVLTDPLSQSQRVSDAARTNPELRELMSDARQAETELARLLNAVEVPDRLHEKLLRLPEAELNQDEQGGTRAQPERHGSPSWIQRVERVARKYRMAIILALLMLIAAGFSLFMPGAAP